jgi:hypothetical protein
MFLLFICLFLLVYSSKKSFHSIHMFTFSVQMFNIHYVTYLPEGVVQEQSFE